MSRNCSSPSFSFGGGRSRCEKVFLKPLSPGPVYSPTPSTKRLGDAPKAKFGTAQQRPRLISASGLLGVQEDSYLTPGPGANAKRPGTQNRILVASIVLSSPRSVARSCICNVHVRCRFVRSAFKPSEAVVVKKQVKWCILFWGDFYNGHRKVSNTGWPGNAVREAANGLFRVS
eukprot:2582355-Pleurochrysis_carterae.AAC.2